MSTAMYQMMINNCANTMKRKAELQKIVESNGMYTPRDLMEEWYGLEGVDIFDLAFGIAVGLAKHSEDVIMDIIAAQVHN